MYIETSSNNQRDNVFCSFERIDFIQITNITFYCNRFSVAGSIKVLLEVLEVLLEGNTWSNRYNKPKNHRSSDSSTDWTMVSLSFTLENYGIKLTHDQIDSAHADLCFSNITITHSVY